MKKRYLHKACITALVFSLCFIYAHVDKMHAIFNEDVDPSFYTGTEVGSDNQFEQEFIVKEETFLDGVALKFATTGEQLERVNLLYLIEDDKGCVLGEGKLEGDKFRSQKYNKLSFGRIDNIKDKKLVFKCYMENNNDQNGISISHQGETMVLRYYASRFDVETFVIACALCMYMIGFMKILFKMFKE